MINYRNTTIFWLIITLIFIISGFSSNLLFGYIFFTLLYIILLVVGAIKINLNFYLKSMIRGSISNPAIALTFDDGPDYKNTPKILEILKRYEIKAAFFCIGHKIEKNTTLIKQIVNDGHIIGNHSYSHSFWFDLFTPNRMARELRRTNNLIYLNTGHKPRLFRPPYGVTNPLLSKALKSTKLISIGWSLRTFDTTLNQNKTLKKLKKKISNGDIILFHDTGPSTEFILEEIILFANNTGKKFVGLDELLKLNVYEN